MGTVLDVDNDAQSKYSPEVAEARRRHRELLQDIDLRYINADLVPAPWELALQREPWAGDEAPTPPGE